SIVEDTKPPIDIELGWNMTVPGLCAHESAVKGGAPIAIPRWDE
ncbi:MAG: gfo/Idh/MocA family oxidoreductase, partial [Anaerolineae bacterium]|nr:gfo/Idh/MocA family oxidoreductase [Anaerolineae bacterium]